MKRLADGEQKTVSSRGARVKVEALREDSETPYVIITLACGATQTLSDVATDDLIKHLTKALHVLPTSK